MPPSPRHPSGLQASAVREDHTRSPRPAAESLTAAGRSTSVDGGADPRERAERESLMEEVERLRKRASRQEEALARLAAAFKALRRAGQALREENRELRLAVQESKMDAEDGGFL